MYIYAHKHTNSMDEFIVKMKLLRNYNQKGIHLILEKGNEITIIYVDRSSIPPKLMSLIFYFDTIVL